MSPGFYAYFDLGKPVFRGKSFILENLMSHERSGNFMKASVT